MPGDIHTQKARWGVPALLVCLLLSDLSAFQGSTPKVIEWDLSWMNDSAGSRVVRWGAPKTVETDVGRGVLFDGAHDGLFLEENPLDGFEEFTLEVLFRPDPDGLAAQRFLHMGEMSRDRVMLETRLTPDNAWYLDAHVRSGDSALTLIDPEKKHPTGEWYHVAFAVRAGQMEAFVNGKPELQGGIPFTAFKGGKTSLGVRQNRVHWFKGFIARARVTSAYLQPGEFMHWQLVPPNRGNQ